MMKQFVVIGLSGLIMLVAGCGNGGNDAGVEQPKAVAPATQTAPPAPAQTPDTNAQAPTPAPTPAAGGGIVRKTLLEAAKSGDLTAIRAALERGDNVNIGDDKFGSTPLMYASKTKCVACVELLIDGGANLESRNSAEATALMWAAMQGSSAVVKTLIEHGADVKAATPGGRTALTLANERAEDEDKALIIVLLEQALRNS